MVAGMTLLLVVIAALAFMRWAWDDEQPIRPADWRARWIPSVWSASNLATVGAVAHYVVKASDGPKPAETHINFTSLDVDAASAYLRQAGYQPQDARHWLKPGSEVVVELAASCPKRCPARLVILDAE
jgi:hypothetical protein